MHLMQALRGKGSRVMYFPLTLVATATQLPNSLAIVNMDKNVCHEQIWFDLRKKEEKKKKD